MKTANHSELSASDRELLTEAEEAMREWGSTPLVPACSRCGCKDEKCELLTGDARGHRVCRWCREGDDPPETHIHDGLLDSYVDDDPPRRVVVLKADECNAIFEGLPVARLTVYTITASETLDLPYFDPDGMTDEQLVRKLNLLMTFA
jgi:hypothetical protein